MLFVWSLSTCPGSFSTRHSGSSCAHLAHSGRQVLHLLGKISRAAATLRKPALAQPSGQRRPRGGTGWLGRGALRGWDQKLELSDRGGGEEGQEREMGHKSRAWKLRIGGPGGEARGGAARAGEDPHSEHPRDEGWQPRGCTTGKQGSGPSERPSSRKRAMGKEQKTPRSHLGT